MIWLDASHKTINVTKFDFTDCLPVCPEKNPDRKIDLRNMWTDFLQPPPHKFPAQVWLSPPTLVILMYLKNVNFVISDSTRISSAINVVFLDKKYSLFLCLFWPQRLLIEQKRSTFAFLFVASNGWKKRKSGGNRKWRSFFSVVTSWDRRSLCVWYG